MASRVAVAVLAAFVFLDLAKFFISERFGTGAAWLLQQDVRALRRSVAQATTPRSLAHRVARERLLRDKERTLLRMQTATLRRALFCSHYISVLKGVLGAAVAIVGWGEPVFSVRREDVWPVGRWLSMPHASEWESGAVAPLPWLAISAAASVAIAHGVLGPSLAFALKTTTRDDHRADAAGPGPDDGGSEEESEEGAEPRAPGRGNDNARERKKAR